MKPTPSKVTIKKVLTETDLRVILAAQERIEKQEKALKEERALLAQLEKEAMLAIQNGAKIEGELSAYIGSEPGKCSPKWKEEYVAHMVAEHKVDEKAFVAEIQAKYPAGPGKKTLVIVEPQQVPLRPVK